MFSLYLPINTFQKWRTPPTLALTPTTTRRSSASWADSRSCSSSCASCCSYSQSKNASTRGLVIDTMCSCCCYCHAQVEYLRNASNDALAFQLAALCRAICALTLRVLGWVGGSPSLLHLHLLSLALPLSRHYITYSHFSGFLANCQWPL